MTIRFYGVRGPYGFLSNFHPAIFKIGDIAYASVEHAYQSFKAITEEDRDKILSAATAATAKRWGAQIERRADWESDVGTPTLHNMFTDDRGCFCQKTKDFYMLQAVIAKFTQRPELRRQLLATGDQELIEASPTDLYWGSGKKNDGLNKLGRMLRHVRTIERSRQDSFDVST